MARLRNWVCASNGGVVVSLLVFDVCNLSGAVGTVSLSWRARDFVS